MTNPPELLTDADREALEDVCWQDYDPPPANEWVLRGDLADLVPVVGRIVRARMADAWMEGHAAGRDYQGDGWNSDAHDPAEDNPYRDEEPTA